MATWHASKIIFLIPSTLSNMQMIAHGPRRKVGESCESLARSPVVILAAALCFSFAQGLATLNFQLGLPLCPCAVVHRHAAAVAAANAAVGHLKWLDNSLCLCGVV